jgi:thymidylate kinase
MPTIIAVDGSSPGIGKSTLCTDLAKALGADHFREEEILTRPEFAAAAAEFNSGGVIRLETILQAMREFAKTSDGVVTDALLPFVPSLLVWGYDEAAIGEFHDALTRAIRPAHVVFVYLDGDPDAALRRACAREESGWLDWLIAKFGVPDRPAMIDHLRRQREITLRLVARQPWSLIVVDADQPADRVLKTTVQHLRDHAKSTGDTP